MRWLFLGLVILFYFGVMYWIISMSIKENKLRREIINNIKARDGKFLIIALNNDIQELSDFWKNQNQEISDPIHTLSVGAGLLKNISNDQFLNQGKILNIKLPNNKIMQCKIVNND